MIKVGVPLHSSYAHEKMTIKAFEYMKILALPSIHAATLAVVM